MPTPLNEDLSEALATRLNLQISLSILPVVEEWMDASMSRWLESVPMPPEIPEGGRARFVVTVGSDRSRLRWGAYGHPSGFIPKMAEYLSGSGVQQAEVDLINEVGEDLEPETVGTWVAVEEGRLVTGWHFLDEHPLSRLGKLLHAGAAGVHLLEWASAVGVERFAGYSQAIGEAPFLDLALPLDGPSLDDRLDTAASAFTAFGGGALPEAARRAAGASPEGGLTLGVRLSDDAVTRVGLLIDTPPDRAVRALSGDLEVPLHEEIRRLEGAIKADGPARIEVFRDGGDLGLDLELIPGSGSG